MNLPRGHKLRDRYQIEKPLSQQGAFGVTYKACDRLFLHDCVVKQLRLRNEITERLFEAEYKHLLTLNLHTQVPNLLDYFEEEEEYYLVQEFIDGNDLSKEIGNGQCMSEEKAKLLVKEILEILVPIHKLGLIHRDIKPQNIMRRKADKKLILIDFGAVKKITESYENNNNQLTVCIGTPGYMPKEQEINGRPILASDIYAIGITGIFALLGIDPKQLKNPENGKIVWRDRIQVTPEFASILDKMIHTKSNMRYSNAMEALKDIYEQLPELPQHYSDEDLNLKIEINSPFICTAEKQVKQGEGRSEVRNSDKQRTFGRKTWNFLWTWKWE